MWNVTNEFKEVNHDGHVYKKGDLYPAEGYEADEERVKFLQKKHEKYGTTFLGRAKQEPKQETTKKEEEKPSTEGDDK
jgi:hypothetical protein